MVDPAGVDGRGCFRGGPAPASSSVQQLDAVQVTGSRIPRAQVEGPAPITVINAEQIRSSGFTSVPDVLRAMTQNGGETQSQQSSSGADFSPGAQQVDLRGLGPNHTLVLVNGRRIADFPMPFKGRSNFTDVSNIPLGMIERIEVLTGSASAIYGSDAIAGVVNFILKKKVDGTTIDMRMGTTSEGGGESFDMSRPAASAAATSTPCTASSCSRRPRCGPMSATSVIRPRTAPPRARASPAALTCVRTTTTTTGSGRGHLRSAGRAEPGQHLPRLPPALRLLLRQRQLDRLRHHPQQAPRRQWLRLAELRLRQRPAMVRRCAAGLPHDVADARRHQVGPHGRQWR